MLDELEGNSELGQKARNAIKALRRELKEAQGNTSDALNAKYTALQREHAALQARTAAQSTLFQVGVKPEAMDIVHSYLKEQGLTFEGGKAVLPRDGQMVPLTDVVSELRSHPMLGYGFAPQNINSGGGSTPNVAANVPSIDKATQARKIYEEYKGNPAGAAAALAKAGLSDVAF